MDISKELTKMIKGIRLGTYLFEELDKKNDNVSLQNNIKKTLEIFDIQLKLMINDATMADYRLSIESTSIPKMSKLMIDVKVKGIKGSDGVKKEAVKGLNMGVYQTIEFLEKHPHLDKNLVSQIQKIIYQYKQMIYYIEKSD